MVLNVRDMLAEDPPLNTIRENSKARGPAITQSVGLLCHVATCKCMLTVGIAGSPKALECNRGHLSTVTTAQYKAELRRLALGKAEIEAQRARLAAVPRCPVCACGGPLMLPEQAGKGRIVGRLFCGSCGVQTGMSQRATAEQIDKARAAAKAEGFEVST